MTSLLVSCPLFVTPSLFVPPAKAGVQATRSEQAEDVWIPAFAGMTAEGEYR